MLGEDADVGEFGELSCLSTGLTFLAGEVIRTSQCGGFPENPPAKSYWLAALDESGDVNGRVNVFQVVQLIAYVVDAH